MLKAAVIGNPIFHSRSPALAHQLFELSQIEGHYSRICGNDIEDLLSLSKYLELNYVNITSPFKNKAAELGLILSSEAYDMKSANTILLDTTNPIALDSDSYALIKILQDLNLSRSMRVLVIGSGATAKLAMDVLSKHANNVFFISARGAKINNYQSINSCDLMNKSFRFDMIVNTHSTRLFDYPPDFFNDSIVIDAIYHKAWLEGFKCKQYIGGIKWLILQGVKSFEFATDCLIDYKIISSSLPNATSGNFYITGFMKAGKTTIARELSSMIGYDFIDLDEMIEFKYGMSIENIFRSFGESGFREYEKLTLKEVTDRTKTIVALGGGTVIDFENVELMKSSGSIIWIFNYLRDILERDDDVRRPLFSGDISLLFDRRTDFYFRSSDLITHNKKAHETVELLAYEIRQII